jgi:hypothetical protein
LISLCLVLASSVVRWFCDVFRLPCFLISTVSVCEKTRFFSQFHFAAGLSVNSVNFIAKIYVLMCNRWACRVCELASGSLRPCDFKYSKLLSSLQTFRCTYNFEIRYHWFLVSL